MTEKPRIAKGYKSYEECKAFTENGLHAIDEASFNSMEKAFEIATKTTETKVAVAVSDPKSWDYDPDNFEN